MRRAGFSASAELPVSPETSEARSAACDWTDMLLTQAGRSGYQTAATHSSADSQRLQTLCHYRGRAARGSLFAVVYIDIFFCK